MEFHKSKLIKKVIVVENFSIISLILGRVVGIFLVIWAIFLIVRKKDCVFMVDKLKDNPTALYVIALAMLPIALTIVIIHPVWLIGWPIFITIIGYSIVLSSLIYLFSPRKAILQLIEHLNKPASYIIHGIVSLIIGIYLVIMSFGL